MDGIHCEPFDGVQEFLKFAPTAGLVLCCDNANAIFELIEGLEDGCWLPVIAYGTAPDVTNVVRAMQAGIASYLSAPFGLEDFRHEYDRLESSLALHIESRHRTAQARCRIERLSVREREILDCMLNHATSKEIARELNISPRTVEAHRASLMARLDVKNATQAIRVAIEGGIFGRTSLA